MSRIAGVDFNTHAIDIVLLDENSDDAEWLTYPLGEDADAFERTRRIRQALPSRGWWLENVIAAGIEQPRGHHGITPLFRVQGAIISTLPTELLVQPWNPSAWRKAVGLPGNATKQQVRDHIEGLPEWSQDACDALCIAYATRAALEKVAA